MKSIDKIKESLEIINKLADGELSKEEVAEARNAIEVVIKDHETQIRVFLVAVAKRKFSRIINLLSLIDKTEEKLLDPSRLAGATTNELIRIYNTAQATLQVDLDYLQKILEIGKSHSIDLKGVNFLQVNIAPEESFPKMDKDVREKIRNYFSHMIEELKGAEEDESRTEDSIRENS